MSQPAISKHLKVLEGAGLISRGQDAQRRPRRLEAKRLEEATEWLERYREFWEGNYQGLDALLEDLKRKQKSGPELYPIALALTSLPSTWMGGSLAKR